MASQPRAADLADMLESFAATLDQSSAVCEHCKRRSWTRFREHLLAESLTKTVEKLRLFAAIER